MRLLILGAVAAAALGGCAATVTTSAEGSAAVPLTEHERSETHVEHATQGCTTSATCEAPMICCFSAPQGQHLEGGYCASQEMCDAVSTTPH